jgi:hypothetical protein
LRTIRLRRLKMNADDIVVKLRCAARTAKWSLLDDAAGLIESLQAQFAEVTQTRDDYATAASAISLWLKEFCDNSLTYDQMIADAARKAANALSESRERERAAIAGRLVLIGTVMTRITG